MALLRHRGHRQQRVGRGWRWQRQAWTRNLKHDDVKVIFSPLLPRTDVPCFSVTAPRDDCKQVAQAMRDSTASCNLSLTRISVSSSPRTSCCVTANPDSCVVVSPCCIARLGCPSKEMSKRSKRCRRERRETEGGKSKRQSGVSLGAACSGPTIFGSKNPWESYRVCVSAK
jgi:hypothetical protein